MSANPNLRHVMLATCPFAGRSSFGTLRRHCFSMKFLFLETWVGNLLSMLHRAGDRSAMLANVGNVDFHLVRSSVVCQRVLFQRKGSLSKGCGSAGPGLILNQRQASTCVATLGVAARCPALKFVTRRASSRSKSLNGLSRCWTLGCSFAWTGDPGRHGRNQEGSQRP